MKNFFGFIFLFFFSIAFSCSTTKQMVVKDMLIELEKTSCSGPCPVYKLQIGNSGNVILEGIENLDHIGFYKSELSTQQLDNLIKRFEQIDFFSLEDSYKSLMMDLPTKYLSYTKNGTTKRIKAYDNIPKELSELINEIDNLVTTLNWKKIK